MATTRTAPPRSRAASASTPRMPRSSRRCCCLRTKATDSAHDGRPAMETTSAGASLIDAFCDRLWLQDGLAPTSLESYRRDLSGFDAWLVSRGKGLLRADRGDLEAWLANQFAAKAKAT